MLRNLKSDHVYGLIATHLIMSLLRCLSVSSRVRETQRDMYVTEAVSEHAYDSQPYP